MEIKGLCFLTEDAVQRYSARMILKKHIATAVIILAMIGVSCAHASEPHQQVLALGKDLNFTSSNDDPAADDMQSIVAKAYGSVTEFWGKPFSEVVNVTLAKNRVDFDAGFPSEWGLNSECWMVGVGVADFMLYLSPAVWAREACEHDPENTQHVLDIATHELAHVYHGQLNPTRDFTGAVEIGWFIEGLAVLVAGQLNRDRYSNPVDAIQQGIVPGRLQDVWRGQHRYALAGSMADYIDKTYGRELLYELMSASSKTDLLHRLGVDEQRLLTEWRTWVLKSEPETR